MGFIFYRTDTMASFFLHFCSSDSPVNSLLEAMKIISPAIASLIAGLVGAYVVYRTSKNSLSNQKMISQNDINDKRRSRQLDFLATRIELINGKYEELITHIPTQGTQDESTRRNFEKSRLGLLNLIAAFARNENIGTLVTTLSDPPKNEENDLLRWKNDLILNQTSLMQDVGKKVFND
jgi:hypothetical protein